MDRESHINRNAICKAKVRPVKKGDRFPWRKGAARQILLLLILPLLLTAIAALLYWGWQVVWQMAPASPQFSLHPANIEIKTPSPWVDRSAILQQVVHEASLDDQLSLLDPGLNERLSLAIADHPWVEAVERVEKFQPPRVEVTLRYREPVAFIRDNSTAGEYPIAEISLMDREGIHLPLEHTRTDAPSANGLAEVRGVPFRPPAAGDVWSDPRIRAAAQIAASLLDEWERLSLIAIEPTAQPIIGTNETYAFFLITRGGRKIPWGPQYLNLPGDKRGKDEPTAKEKAGRLKRYVRENGIDLDGHPHAISQRPPE